MKSVLIHEYDFNTAGLTVFDFTTLPNPNMALDQVIFFSFCLVLDIFTIYLSAVCQVVETSTGRGVTSWHECSKWKLSRYKSIVLADFGAYRM